ncbi:hypothetical protein [Mesorhizobium sp. L103C131B0]|uniref:hypothetical protein n=1 Tax=Mesorhizobium sp. L103C131B0 TaxID=1287089 RepID=UPI0003D03E8F|nr:hypothetical protein [Mesorhizobium sp. L103C131B0]ESZ56641.1 hypothetical protein X729_24220 [Mesorhizobium sp. L103C131B0]
MQKKHLEQYREILKDRIGDLESSLSELGTPAIRMERDGKDMKAEIVSLLQITLAADRHHIREVEAMLKIGQRFSITKIVRGNSCC